MVTIPTTNLAFAALPDFCLAVAWRKALSINPTSLALSRFFAASTANSRRCLRSIC